MGFKASMIIIREPSIQITEEELLSKLGFSNVRLSGETTYEECMYPNDKSLNIGYYNDSLIISDDFQLTASLELSESPHLLSKYERTLSEIFPGKEILTVACHSGVNYHMYSLIKNGIKLRFKKVVHGEPLLEYGERISEEEMVYQGSKIIDGRRMFRGSAGDNNYDNTEDQLMEDFAFGVAKRHLGVMISTSEDEVLMFETPFKKYFAENTTKIQALQTSAEGVKPKKASWFSRLFKN